MQVSLKRMQYIIFVHSFEKRVVFLAQKKITQTEPPPPENRKLGLAVQEIWRKHFQGKTTPINRRYNKQNHQKNTKTEKNPKKQKKQRSSNYEPPNLSLESLVFLFFLFFLGFFGFQLWSLILCREFCSWGLPVGDAMLKWQVQPYFFSGWVDSWRKVAKGDCTKRGRSQRCFQFAWCETLPESKYK